MPRGAENPFKRTVRSCLIELSMRTGLFDRSIFSLYNYMFSPSQLVFLTQCLAEVRDIPGCCVEIGCAQGRTTVFLRKFMDENGIAKDYWALDTFGGFVAEHVDYEVARRDKSRVMSQLFVANKRSWFEHSLTVSGVDAVNSVEGDATKFDFDRIAPIAFALLDVDLYLPIKDILPKLYRNLSPGGVMLIDDCMPHQLWDGALAAYEEFAASNGIERRIVLGKLGVIRKA
jgi:O-methyltransferase